MTMQSAAYQHSNSLTYQVLSEVKIVQDNVLQAIETHTSQIDTDSDESTPPDQTQAVNTTTPDAV